MADFIQLCLKFLATTFFHSSSFVLQAAQSAKFFNLEESASVRLPSNAVLPEWHVPVSVFLLWASSSSFISWLSRSEQRCQTACCLSRSCFISSGVRTERSITDRLSETPNIVLSLFAIEVAVHRCTAPVLHPPPYQSSPANPVYSVPAIPHNEPFLFLNRNIQCLKLSFNHNPLLTDSLHLVLKLPLILSLHSHSCLNRPTSPCCWRMSSSSSLSLLHSSWFRRRNRLSLSDEDVHKLLSEVSDYTVPVPPVTAGYGYPPPELSLHVMSSLSHPPHEVVASNFSLGDNLWFPSKRIRACSIPLQVWISSGYRM